MSGLGVRRRLLLVVVAAVATALAALVAGFNVLLARSLSHDADALLRSRATAELALLRTEDGRLVVDEAPDAAAADSQLWLFSRGRALEAPRAGATLAAAARRL